MVDPAVERNLQDVSPLVIMKLPSEEQEIVAVSCFPDSIVDPANTFTMTNEDVMQNMQTGSKREVGLPHAAVETVYCIGERQPLCDELVV